MASSEQKDASGTSAKVNLARSAVEKELAENRLDRINIAGFSEKYEFNFVFLKDSIYKKDYLEWYNLLKNFR